MILAALAAGIAAGMGDTATRAIKDGYEGLKGLLTRKFSDNPKALEVLKDHEQKPEIHEGPLAEQLRETGADKDLSILAAAEQLVKTADENGIKTKFQVTVTGGKIGIVGDHGTVTMY